MYNDDEQEQNGKENQSFPAPATRVEPQTGTIPSANQGSGRED